MKNALNLRGDILSLLRFSLPTIVMMVFNSLYTMIDGIFVARYIDTTALSAVNIIYPVVNIVLAVGIMFATGGSAIIAKKMGEEKNEEARQDFSYIFLVAAGIGVILTIICLVFIREIPLWLGANEANYAYCLAYAEPYVCFIIPGIAMMLYMAFFVTAGKPGLGLLLTVAGGVVNIVLDYLMIGVWNMGIQGAAIATGLGYLVPAVFGTAYFLFHRKGSLYFGKPKHNKTVLRKSMLNGSSEMVTNLSTAFTTFLFNIILMRLVGQDGVAAATIVLYSQYFLMSIYLGFSSGVAPVFSFQYGKQDNQQLKQMYRNSMGFIALSSLAVAAFSYFGAPLLVRVFAEPDNPVYALTVHAQKWFSSAFLFMGINVFASSFYTALSNGKLSALISFLRTFLFITGGLLLLPVILHTTGVWIAIPAAEALTAILSLICMTKWYKQLEIKPAAAKQHLKNQ